MYIKYSQSNHALNGIYCFENNISVILMGLAILQTDCDFKVSVSVIERFGVKCKIRFSGDPAGITDIL